MTWQSWPHFNFKLSLPSGVLNKLVLRRLGGGLRQGVGGEEVGGEGDGAQIAVKRAGLVGVFGAGCKDGDLLGRVLRWQAKHFSNKPHLLAQTDCVFDIKIGG